jgi:hypothetical protein
LINRINYFLLNERITMSVSRPVAPKANAVLTKKPATKVATKAVKVTKLATSAAPKAKAAPKPAPAAKPAQAMKPKLVRDSFTLPEAEHALIKQCKKAAIMQGRETKKSEVVRAAMQVFHALPLQAQLAAYNKLSVVAVGRPKLG